MNFKSVKKIGRKLLLAMLLSSSFSLNASAIGPQQEKAIEQWLTMMKLDVERGKEVLQYKPLKIKNYEFVDGDTTCYLVPIYNDKSVEEFFIDLYSNKDYKEYMRDFFGNKGMMTPQDAKAKYEKALMSMYNSKDPKVYGYEYLDGLPGSLEFLIYYENDLAGHLSIGPMRHKSPVTTKINLSEDPNDISKVSVVINKKYSRKGIFLGLREFSSNARYLKDAYRNDSKNERYNLNMLYASLSPNQSKTLEKTLINLLGFLYDPDVTEFFRNNDKTDASSSPNQPSTFLTKVFGFFRKSAVDNNKPDDFNYYYKTV